MPLSVRMAVPKSRRPAPVSPPLPLGMPPVLGGFFFQ